MTPLAVVVVPARDEEERIGGCLASLAVQAGVAPGDLEVLVVLDGCCDGTEQAIAAARRAHPWLPVTTLRTAGEGAGLARAAGLRAARERRPRLLCSTDADSAVGHEWIAAQRQAVGHGAGAVAGRVELDAVEAAALDPAILAGRAAEARIRLQAVRGWAPEAEHGTFSAASLALTPEAYDAVGGLPAVPTGEDDALERALRAAGVRIAYPRGARVTTSARPGGRMTRPVTVAAQAAATPGGVTPLVVAPPAGRRGAALREALTGPGGAASLVVCLPPDIEDPAAAVEALTAPLLADPSVVLVKGTGAPHPLEDVLARPLLELHARELTAVRSPLSPAWAARRTALSPSTLPPDDAVDLAVLVDVWRAHGLAAVAQVPVALPQAVVTDEGALAYALLATVGGRVRERPAPPLWRSSPPAGEVGAGPPSW